MSFSSIMALVHYNGHIFKDQQMSSIYVSKISSYVELNNYMTLSFLKQTILNLFIASYGKSYTLDLCYRYPVTMDDFNISYRSMIIEYDYDVPTVISYAKRYEAHVQFEIMAFIREYNHTPTNMIWELMEKQLDDSLNIE
ncbi:uncharacterized protein HKW66_Vig0227930 [Vigna angularis]|uniref:Uncharacterized protein n=1 Tax=Phaseolus angularis TaxID=3914 RepID=A0A8T0KAQ9_PHAAN|nr:uncharacterized protein HKW66_Vig0227930 [Vigna angularis]